MGSWRKSNFVNIMSKPYKLVKPIAVLSEAIYASTCIFKKLIECYRKLPKSFLLCFLLVLVCVFFHVFVLLLFRLFWCVLFCAFFVCFIVVLFCPETDPEVWIRKSAKVTGKRQTKENPTASKNKSKTQITGHPRKFDETIMKHFRAWKEIEGN